MSRRPIHALATAAATAFIVLAGRPAWSDELPAAPIADAQLEDMRGGWFTADGIQFGFGAVLQTTVNGQMAMQTQVTWTNSGPQITQQTGANVGMVSNGQITGLNLQGLTPQQVAVLNNGATALIQKVTGGVVQNIVLNAADGQTIQQSTQLQLSLPGFAQTQQVLQQNLAMLHMIQAGQIGGISFH